MAFKPGTRFGAYEIQATLGAGGMGEVYRARDTRLGRDVAVKILPEHQADAARRERFQREARAVAALSHPNICTIHDVGHEGGVDFLVMEFIDGESLATRLTRGPLPLAQALNLAMEIAEGLSAAHRHGIVHRDLKPGNVMLTRTGSGKPHAAHAKVLDFGLATMLANDDNPSDRVSLAETAPAALTQMGSVIGTPQYMAPEQIEGRRVDARTDIFAFGAVLFEMLTGHIAFEASSSPGLMAAILKGETPSLAKHLATASPDLDWVVRTCLEKDPDDRFASMHDVLLQLRRIASIQPSDGRATAAPLTRRWIWPAIAAASVAIAVASFMWAGAGGSQERPNPIELTVLPPNSGNLGAGVSVSPDGQSLAAVALTGPGSPPVLWIRQLRSIAATVVRGSEGANYPFWSPDGRSVAFFAQGKLKRVDVDGGTPVAIADVVGGRGGAWFEDGTIVVATLEDPGLLRVPASGGTPTVFVPVDAGSGIANFRYPVRVGLRRVLYLALAEDEENSELRLTSLDDPGSWVSVVRTRQSGAYVDGFLLFERDRLMVSQAFDVETGSLSGEIQPLTDLPRLTNTSGNIGYAQLASGGRTIAWTSRPTPTGQLTWLGRDGVRVGTLGTPDAYGSLALSPDDKQLAVSIGNRLAVLDTSSGTRRDVANEPGVGALRWSPDGTRVTFQASRGLQGSINLYGVAIGQPFKVEPLAEAPIMLQSGGWTPEGAFIWLQPLSQTIRGPRPGPSWYNDRGVLMRHPGGEPALVTADADSSPLAVSPDGRFMAYARQRGAQVEVCVSRVEISAGCQPVGFSGAVWPSAILWRGDGRELIIRSGDDVMGVPVQPGVLPAGVRAVRLFQISAAGIPGGAIAVTSGGDRFLVFEPGPTPPETITVAVNWSRTD